MTTEFAAPVFGIKAKLKPAAKVVAARLNFYIQSKKRFILIRQQLWPQVLILPDTNK